MSYVCPGKAVMGLRTVCWMTAGLVLGCGAAASTPTVQATRLERSPEEARALLGYHLALIALRIDTQCPDRALPAVLDAGAEAQTRPPCTPEVDAEEAMLMGWLEQLPDVDALGAPQVLPADESCEAPDPEELRAALELAEALRQRLREESDPDSVAAITLRALVRQQLTTALDRKWTLTDVGAADQARVLIPTTSRESTSLQVQAMFSRAQVEPEPACLVQDDSVAPWEHPETWVRGPFLETPAAITGPRILFQPALFNYDGVIFAVSASRTSMESTLASLEASGAVRLPWPDEVAPRPGLVLLRKDFAEGGVGLWVVVPGATDQLIVSGTITAAGEPSDVRLHGLTASLATLTRSMTDEVVFDAPIAVDDPEFTWRSSSTLLAPTWTWSQEPPTSLPRRPTVVVMVTPALVDVCTQNTEVPPTPVVRFGLRGCEMVGARRGMFTVTTMLSSETQMLVITAVYPDAPDVTEASVLTWAHGLLDRTRLLRAF